MIEFSAISHKNKGCVQYFNINRKMKLVLATLFLVGLTFASPQHEAQKMIKDLQALKAEQHELKVLDLLVEKEVKLFCLECLDAVIVGVDQCIVS